MPGWPFGLIKRVGLKTAIKFGSDSLENHERVLTTH